jgi:hypothetical protein
VGCDRPQPGAKGSGPTPFKLSEPLVHGQEHLLDDFLRVGELESDGGIPAQEEGGVEVNELVPGCLVGSLPHPIDQRERGGVHVGGAEPLV